MSLDQPLPSIALPAGPRWRLVALLSMMVAMAHFNRISITVAGAEAIIPHQGISPTEMGWIYTAYLLIYTLAMSPGGWFIDRFGPRAATFVVGAGSAVFVMLTGLTGLLWSGTMLWLGLLVVRGSMGVVNAPTHPSAARLVGNWIPPGQRCFVNGLVNFTACIGMASTYLVFGMLMDRFEWTGASFVAAGATLVLAIVWGVFARSSPSNDAGPGRQRAAASTLPMVSLFRNQSLMFLTLSYAAVNYFEYLFFYWAQYYFKHEHQLPDEVSRWYSSLLTITMGLGMMGGGFITDWTRHHFPYRYITALVPVVGLIVSAIMLIAGLVCPSPILALLCFGIATAAVGSSEGAFWTLAVEIGG